MKRMISLVLALLCLCGCAAKPAESAKTDEPTAEEPTEVVVFAAASLLETLTEIGEQYKTVAPGVALTFSFDSSGTLKSQIEAGADCDLFVSAAPKQMNALRDAGLIDEASRVELLENRVVLAAAEDSPKGVTGFDALAERLPSGEVLLAMGNSDVPVGQYTQKIFAYYGLDEAALAAAGTLTYGGNVKEVTAQVTAGAADCGVVYATDAVAAGLTVLDTATPAMCGRVVYPAAVLSGSRRSAEAAAFLAYLQSPEAAAVFEAVGFTALGK